MKIYITYTKNSFTEEQIEELEKIGKVYFLEKVFALDKAPYLEDDEEKILLVDPDWYNWDMNKEHLGKIKKLKKLKAICLSTTAYDWINLKYCRNNHIIVTNIPKYSTDSVAEYAIFLMMCLAKKFPLQLKKNLKMEYSQEMLTTEIRNKTVGIIGLGTIGSRVAELCSNLGMNVLYWNRTNKENNYKNTDLETIFTNADFIFPMFATNDETKKIISDKLINKMKDNAFINVINNPKEIYNHPLMIELAEQGKISYAFEIYNNENMYKYKGNIMTTSPYSFYTKEAIERLVAIWCENTISIINGKEQNIVL